MSFMDVVSYWRCPNCNSANELHHGWRSWIRYRELPMEMYTAEKCDQCGRQYYVAESNPDPIVFKMDRGRCKNDYIRDLVLPEDHGLTLDFECVCC